MWIVVTGNLIDGYEFEGLFNSHEDAMDYAVDNYDGMEWIACEIKEKKER